MLEVCIDRLKTNETCVDRFQFKIQVLGIIIFLLKQFKVVSVHFFFLSDWIHVKGIRILVRTPQNSSLTSPTPSKVQHYSVLLDSSIQS